MSYEDNRSDDRFLLDETVAEYKKLEIESKKWEEGCLRNADALKDMGRIADNYRLEIKSIVADYNVEHKIHHAKIQSLQSVVDRYSTALKSVCEHLEYLCIALAEQTTGNADKLAMWNSASTVTVLKDAQALVYKGGIV